MLGLLRVLGAELLHRVQDFPQQGLIHWRELQFASPSGAGVGPLGCPAQCRPHGHSETDKQKQCSRFVRHAVKKDKRREEEKNNGL